MVRDASLPTVSAGNGPVSGSAGSATWRPLSRVAAGGVFVVRRLDGTAETNQRLREMGFGEQQRVRVISLQSHVLCQVCNARLGVSARLADVILVEPLGMSGVGMSLPA